MFEGDDAFTAMKPLVETDPHISTRRISRESYAYIGVSQQSVVRYQHKKG